jgi:hypothetical protein
MVKTSYCGPTCQREDWPRHKAGEYMVDLSYLIHLNAACVDCKSHKMLKAAKKAFQSGKPMPKDNTMPVYSADFSGNMVMVNGP